MISYDSGGKTVKILLMSLILILSVIIICAVVAQEEKTPGMGAAILRMKEGLLRQAFLYR